VRVIAAIHGNLLDDVRRGEFRLELYYELAVGLLRIPPLRDRKRDLELLIDYFLGELAGGGTSLRR
jgi:transcriptional regulator with PAS, ATPase and Fis domain